MNTTPCGNDAAPDYPHTESNTGADSFAEVLVYVGILRTTAEMLVLLHDFLSDADPTVRTHLGCFLIARHPDRNCGDPSIEAAMLVDELTEAADLLYALTGQ